MMRSISLQNEEREALLDTFSECETYLREEAALAAQCFDDLGCYCPDLVELCEPLEGIDEKAQSGYFRIALEDLGITTAHDLAERSGISLAACSPVFDNPIRCDPKERARVIKGLETRACAELWSTSYRPLFGSNESVGDFLHTWLRRNFKTPFQFLQEAKRCELKSYFIGAANGLSESDVDSLLRAPYFMGVIKDAAAAARLATERERAAIERVLG